MLTSGEPAAPLLRGIIFDWYDGPVTGIARVDPDGPAYAFQMVAWDDGQDVRVYVLRPIRNDVVERADRLDVKAVLRASEAERKRAWAEMQAILRGAGEIAHVVVSDALLKGPVSGREVPPGEFRARVAAMLLEEPGESDRLCYSEHSMADWLSVIDPLRPYERADLR
jgi:hypothetical protein